MRYGRSASLSCGLLSSLPFAGQVGRRFKARLTWTCVLSALLCGTHVQTQNAQPLVARGSERPSFDCSKAKTASAQLICADDELARLDGQLGAAFQKRKGQIPATEQQKFVAEQIVWIRERNKGCDLVGKDSVAIEALAASKPCMMAAIQSRIAEFSQTAREQGQPNSTVEMIEADKAIRRPATNAPIPLQTNQPPVPVQMGGANGLAQDRRYCDGMDGATPDQRIAGCTAVIQAATDPPQIMSAAFNLRGAGYAAKAQHDRAVADFDQSLRIQPNNVSALFNRCTSRNALAQYQQALSDCNEAIRLLPQNADFIGMRGFVYQRMNQLDRAVADYDAALRIDPNRPYTLYARGVIKLKTGDTNAGNADIAAAKKTVPNIAEEFARLEKGLQISAAEVAREQAARKQAQTDADARSAQKVTNIQYRIEACNSLDTPTISANIPAAYSSIFMDDAELVPVLSYLWRKIKIECDEYVRQHGVPRGIGLGTNKNVNLNLLDSNGVPRNIGWAGVSSDGLNFTGR